VTTDECDTTT